ncbi:hypothetical protein F9C07_2206469 [Aspergillus flavus]|uniref:Saposin B-type domain-containing protein n=1 Tax=Aspergillus flavus (strain ATCC 200026 / FGSC A1120 / IAM 13836 / NRRL 3357 / JCM 12722 / SRRC 167) TaxID=332952 RepID=A0A7U2QQT9_ASPFN|nr:hypothetical protein F9C07_2206469 [Aspergillus flavus]
MVKLIITSLMSGLTLALAASSIAGAENTLLQRDIGCDYCIPVTQAILDLEEGFDVALTGAMENACSLLPVDVAGCKNYIDVYGNMIGKYLGQDRFETVPRIDSYQIRHIFYTSTTLIYVFTLDRIGSSLDPLVGNILGTPEA